MATKKQIGLLLARAADAGVKAEWGDFADLDNGAIDDKLAEFEQIKKGEMVGDGAYRPARTTDLNSQRFGMVCKIVIRKTGVDYAIKDRAGFASLCLSLYNSVTYAETTVKKHLPANPADIVTAE